MTSARLDSDAIADTLRGVSEKLLKDERGYSLAFRLDDLRRDIARALAAEPTPRRRRPACEADHQAMIQGGADRALMGA